MVLDREYELRFEQDDVMACEEELKMGYIFFFRIEKVGDSLIPITLSLRLLRSLLHHGLKLKDNRGEYVYALPQSSDGAVMAGDLIKQFKQRGGKDIDLWRLCMNAFSDWFADPGEQKTDSTEKIPGADTKNLPAAGKKRQSRTRTGSADLPGTNSDTIPRPSS